jgi:hypothetical protein
MSRSRPTQGCADCRRTPRLAGRLGIGRRAQEIRRRFCGRTARLPCTYPGAMRLSWRRLPRRHASRAANPVGGFGRVRFLVLVLPRVIPHSGESPAHRQHANSRGWHQSRSAAHGNVKFVSTTFRFLIVVEYRTFSRLRGSIHILTGGRGPRPQQGKGEPMLFCIAALSVMNSCRLIASPKAKDRAFPSPI